MKRRKQEPVVLTIEEIATKANDVVSDVDMLVMQIKAIVEDQKGDR